MLIPFTPAWFRARADKKAQTEAAELAAALRPASPGWRPRVHVSGPAPAYRSTSAAPAPAPTDSSDFATSYAVSRMTDSTPLGYMAGGSLLGSMLGSSHASSPAPSPSVDWGRSTCDSDSSSSYSSSSSSDYSSSSSCDSSSSSSDSSSSSSSSWD